MLDQVLMIPIYFRYLESLGGSIPPKSEAPKSEPKVTAPEEQPMEEEESEESDVELDMTGVIDPDNDAPQSMGNPDKVEFSDDEMDKFSEKRSEAMAAFSEGEWQKSIDLFTEAIEINATSAMPFVKRGACYLKTEKPNACIRDCDRAIEINPDNAAAHKFRGRAHR